MSLQHEIKPVQIDGLMKDFGGTGGDRTINERTVKKGCEYDNGVGMSCVNGSALSAAIASSPLPPGIARSMSIRSGCVARACCMASRPVAASTVS